MEIKLKAVGELIPADYNPRKKSQHVLDAIIASVKKDGWLVPFVFSTHQCERCGDRRNIIISGHRRLDAAKQMGFTEVPAIGIDVHREHEEELNRILNAQEQDDKTKLSILIERIHLRDPEAARLLGMSQQSISELLAFARYHREPLHAVLAEKFLIAPFSVFNSRSGEWQRRKDLWKEVLGNLSETRESKLAGSVKNILMMSINAGVSTFDPVTSEVILQWFSPEKGKILDPFAGSLSRGGVAAALGFDYTGIEIRKEQIEANEKRLREIGAQARFIHADAKDLNKVIPESEQFDLIFTCPPYYDLEIYSSDQEDLSTKQTYEEFMIDYETIFRQATSRLKENRFAVVVLGDIRDEKGFYRNFIGDNITLFKKLGFELYNEIIYIETTATAPYRAERNMRKRKVVKTHQNVMTFYKGDAEILKNPQLLERHHKVLAFLKGDPEQIKEDFKNPPAIKRDIMATLADDPIENVEDLS